ECGDVTLGVGDVTVRIGPSELGDGSYRFRCPGCAGTVTCDASSRIVDLLVSAGAPHERCSWPLQLAERPRGPALTDDAPTAFQGRPGHGAWLERLGALVRPAPPE